MSTKSHNLVIFLLGAKVAGATVGATEGAAEGIKLLGKRVLGNTVGTIVVGA